MKKDLFRVYESDASGLKGEVLDVVHPKSVGEVRNAVLKNDRIVIRGAGTGLAGGAVPQNEVVLDLSKMIRISNFDKEKKTIEVEAGVVLDDLQDYVRGVGLEFPVNPASHAVATIGGMIATNAVGSRGVKYGRTSAWVKWIEVMDSFGKVEKKSIMEMSDYVGMEGISGIILRACLKLNVIRERSVKLIRAESYDEVVSVVRNLKRNSSVSMIEFFGKLVSEKLGLEEKYHLIVEYEQEAGLPEVSGLRSQVSGTNKEQLKSRGLVGDDYEKVMSLRERIGPVLGGEGFCRVEDPKVLIDKSDKLIRWLEVRGVPVFGHIGVGIFHPRFNEDQEKYIPEMMKLVKRLGGQVSGEHGIGLLKRGFVEVNDQKILRNVKKRTDPLGKFNVGKVI